MKTEIPMRRKGGALHAIDQISDDDLRNAATEGATVMVTVRSPRSLYQHRLAWGLAQLLRDALGMRDRDEAMKLLKIKSGHVDYIQNPKTREVHVSPKSISFDKCKQDEFNIIFNRFILSASELLDGVPESTIRKEIENIIDGRMKRAGAP